MRMYSVRDSKAETYSPPVFRNLHGEAERDFKTMVNDGKSQISHYPEDFDLFYLGEINLTTGILKPLDTPQHIIKAIALKQ